MGTLKVPGVQLFYEVSGSGPLLILIPGARGDGAVFRPLAHHLSAQYQVVTYDRRDFSRSSLAGPADDDHRLATDADDVRRLIEHLTGQPATVLATVPERLSRLRSSAARLRGSRPWWPTSRQQ